MKQVLFIVAIAVTFLYPVFSDVYAKAQAVSETLILTH